MFYTDQGNNNAKDSSVLGSPTQMRWNEVLL